MTRRRLSLPLAALALALAAVAAGCGGSPAAAPPAATTTAPPAQTTTTPPPASGACLSVPPGLDRAILSHVVLADARLLKLRAAPAPATPGYYYVSASVSGSGAKNLLATWVTRDLQGKHEIYSVDANAALISEYGASTGASLSLTVGAPGSFRSRKCVAGSKATPGEPAPPSNGGGAPAGN